MPRKVNIDLEYKRRFDELERRYKEALEEAELMKKKRIEKLEAWKAGELAIAAEAAKRKREKILAPKATPEEKYAKAKKEEEIEQLRKKYEDPLDKQEDSDEEEEEQQEEQEQEKEEEVKEVYVMTEAQKRFMMMTNKEKISFMNAALKKQKPQESVDQSIPLAPPPPPPKVPEPEQKKIINPLDELPPPKPKKQIKKSSSRGVEKTLGPGVVTYPLPAIPDDD